MTRPWVWGVDPGTTNIGVTLLSPTGHPVYVVEARVVGKDASARRWITRWGCDPGAPAQLQRWARVETRDEDPLDHVVDAINAMPAQGEERAVVELVGGPVSRGLMIASGILQGVLWARTGHRPAEVAASTWRKEVLGLHGRTKAAPAERVAREWASIGVWNDECMGHAAESRAIATYGLNHLFCLP